MLHEIFRNKDRYQHVSVNVIYANQTEDDILVRSELEALQRDFPSRFHLWYTIDRVTGDASKWKYSTGFIDQKMIEEHLLFEDKSKPTQFFMVRPSCGVLFVDGFCLGGCLARRKLSRWLRTSSHLYSVRSLPCGVCFCSCVPNSAARHQCSSSPSFLP